MSNYLEDKDLEFLKDCANEDLKALADLLVFDKDGKKRWNEKLSSKKSYMENYPNTLKNAVDDIILELQKPGRDPREAVQEFSFADDIHEIDDLKPGMELPGIVTNITAFGAFVDIGLHENGLIHASQMGVKGMAVPSKVLKLHQHVTVQVLSVDLERNRIGLKLLK